MAESKKLTLAVPGSLFVGADDKDRWVVHLGAAAGWFRPMGIAEWSREVSVVQASDLTEEVQRESKLVAPEAQIAPARFPHTLEAVRKAPLLAVAPTLSARLIELGVRVHTIGVDRLTGSLYYIADGGGEPAVRAEGDLIQAVAGALDEGADNDAIERLMDGIHDRILRALSKGRVTELAVELACRLPRAAADGTGMEDVDLDASEAELTQLVAESAKAASRAKDISDRLAGAGSEKSVTIPLYGEARKHAVGPAQLTLGAESIALPLYSRWLVDGVATIPSDLPPPKVASVRPSASVPAAVKRSDRPAAPTPAAAAKAAPAKAATPITRAASPKPAPVAASPKPAPAAAKAAEPSPKPAPAAAKAA